MSCFKKKFITFNFIFILFLNSAFAQDPETIIAAKVNDHIISAKDVLITLERLPKEIKEQPLPKIYPDIVNELINQHLIAQRAYKDKFDQNKEVLSQIKKSKDSIMAKYWLKDYIDSPKYKAGVFRPDIGGIHPSKLLHEMIRIALRDNVKIFSHTASQSIKRVGQTFTIPTHRGSVTAEHVIVATNAYTGKEFPWLRSRLIPVISEIIATEELGENFVSHLMPRKTMFAEALELGHYYRPSPDGKRILLGGRRLGANPEKARERLRTGLVGILPQLKDTAITHHWLGNVAFPFDQLPKIAVNDGVIYPAGFCGSGTVWARWLGQKAAGMILGKDAETVFSGHRFWALPFYNGNPWFLPIAMNYYKLRDKISSKSK